MQPPQTMTPTDPNALQQANGQMQPAPAAAAAAPYTQVTPQNTTPVPQTGFDEFGRPLPMQLQGHPAQQPATNPYGTMPVGQPMGLYQPAPAPGPAVTHLTSQPTPEPTPAAQTFTADQVQQMIDEAVIRAQAPNEGYQTDQAQTQQVDPNEQLANMMFEDPARFVQEFRTGVVQEITQQQAQQQNVQRLWDKFYSTYPQFDRGRDHGMVENIARQHIDSLWKMPEDQGLNQLASLAHNQMQNVAGYFGIQPQAQPQMAIPTVQQPVGEAPNPIGQPNAQPQQAVQPAPTEPPSSLSQVLRQRQAKRMGAVQ